MRILAINTATDALGVGIVDVSPGSREPVHVVAELILGAAPSRSGHSERLMPAIAWVSESAGTLPADLAGIAVVAGPGGFTGVRSGLAVAKAVSQARGIPVASVDTLEALAAGYPGEGLISPLLDARRGEVFAALYRRERDGALELLQAPILVPLADWLGRLAAEHRSAAIPGTASPDQPARIAFVGEGALHYPDTVATHPGAIPLAPEAHLLRPSTIARLAAPRLAAGGEDPVALVPRYHRAPAMAPQWEPSVGTKSW